MDISEIYRKIFSQLNTKDYVSAKKICSEVNMSEKTLRKYLHEFDDFLKENGASLDIKPGKGYRLKVLDKETFSKNYFFNILQVSEKYTYSEEKRRYRILQYLLEQHGYVPLEKLTEIFYVSEETILSDIRKLKEKVKRHGITLEVSLTKGARISGPEIQLRRYLMECLTRENLYTQGDGGFYAEVSQIYSIVVRHLSDLEISVPELSIYNIVMYIDVSLNRIRGNFPISFPKHVYQEMSTIYENIYGMTASVCLELSLLFDVQFGENELVYITLQFIGSRALKIDDPKSANVVVTDHILQMTDDLLEYIYLFTGYDFRDILNLKMDLWKHLTAMEIRVKFDIFLDNPLLKEVKQEYPTAYLIASEAASILEKNFSKKVDVNEVGYLAIIFGLHLEQINGNLASRKKNILIVSEAGKTAAQLLITRYKKNLADYVDVIETANQNDLGSIDFKKFDCIITTMQISRKVPVPVIEVDNLSKISNVLMTSQAMASDKVPLYDKKLFFHVYGLDSREKIIRYMFDQISQVRNINEDFLKSVLERELRNGTDYFEMVAMPHPLEKVTDEKFACVCILDKPVYWSRREVQLVIMTSVFGISEQEKQIFFDCTSDFVLDAEKVSKAVARPDFTYFINLLSE